MIGSHSDQAMHQAFTEITWVGSSSSVHFNGGLVCREMKGGNCDLDIVRKETVKCLQKKSVT